MNSLMLLVGMLMTFSSFAQNSILGKWKTVDENSGKARSVIELIGRNGKFYGKVILIFTQQGEDPDPVCDKCSSDDQRFNKKVIGMEIIQEMIPDDDAFTGGSILDPEVGKVYRCKIWREGEDLKVRGYIGPFFRTQTWIKYVP